MSKQTTDKKIVAATKNKIRDLQATTKYRLEKLYLVLEAYGDLIKTK